MREHRLVRHSYNPDEVTVLLEDLGNLMTPIATEERERLIQSGIHYSEMLPLEYEPTREYMEVYEQALHTLGKKTAEAVQILAYRLMQVHEEPIVIISLARAGLPIGILLRRALKQLFKFDCPHYSISIIRGKGIDINAMKYIYEKEGKRYGTEHFQFIDGWVGKGAISGVLEKSCEELRALGPEWAGISSTLGVVSDPANTTSLCGTHEDFLIPSACLNSTVSGLVSRTILNRFIGPNDFHGGVYYQDLESVDHSKEFIDTITSIMEESNPSIYDLEHRANEIAKDSLGKSGMDTVVSISRKFGIGDVNLIKPGVGETTRVLLRRMPWKVLIDTSKKSQEGPSERVGATDPTEGLEHIIQLCKEKNIPIEEYPLGNYRACGIIKDLSADA